MAGTPMVILRLQGCDVGCPFCDTKYTWNTPEERHMQSSLEIAKLIEEMSPQIKWVMVTGGEPAMYKLYELVAAIHYIGKKVAIETSGTATGHIGSGADWVTVSPKIHTDEQGKKIVMAAFDYASEIKMVVGKPAHIEAFDKLLSYVYIHDTDRCIISLQPMSLSKNATELCLKTCLERGWHLSLQTHKYIDVP